MRLDHRKLLQKYPCPLGPLPPRPPLPHDKPPYDRNNQLMKISMIVTVGMVSGVLLAGIVFIIMRKYYSRRNRTRRRNSPILFATEEDHLDEDHEPPVIEHHIWYINSVGIQQSVIDSITVCKYKKDEGLIDGTECSVCLSEFEEDESLRLLPKCSHAFHLPCIDTWLRSHKNCPLCRAPITSNAAGAGSQSTASEPSTSSSGSSQETHVENLENYDGVESNQAGEGGTSEVGVRDESSQVAEISEKSLQNSIRDQHSVAKHLFAAITSFIESDRSLKFRPIYITGESYAGKYVPAIGYYIINKNAELPASERVNLAGVAIGNGLTDPVIQVGTHAVNAYFSGLINHRQKRELEKAQREAVGLTKSRNWTEATNARNRVLRLLENMTGLATLYDFTRKFPYNDELVTEFLQNEEAKRALGVNESMVFEECSDVVGDALHEDVMKSVKYMVEFLVKQSKVMLYQGHFDLRDGVVSTEAWVKTMKWEGIEEFVRAERKVWKVNGELAGYVQKWGSLSNVVVLGAGHLVPADQALNSQAMIEDWVLERGLFGYQQGEDFSSNFRPPKARM